MSDMLRAFGGMLTQQPQQSQEMFEQLLQSVGNGVRAGMRSPNGVLVKEDIHRI